MADLLDAVARLQSDPACMDRLAHGSGMLSLATAQSSFHAAVPIAVNGLLSTISTTSGAKAMLHRAQMWQESGDQNVGACFTSTDDSSDDELMVAVFGSDVSGVIDSLALHQGIDPYAARTVLEAATAATLAMTMRLADKPLSLETLTAPILAEQETLRMERPRAQAARRSPVGAFRGEGDAGNADAGEPSPVPRAVALVRGPTGLGRRIRQIVGAGATVLAITLLGSAVVLLSRGGDPPSALPFVGDSSEAAPVDGTETRAPDTTALTYPAPALSTDSPPVPLGAPENYAVMSGGKIYLRGFVPSTDVERLIIAAVGEVLGPENVVGEYQVDPSRPFVEGREVQVYVEETVLFASGSDEISPDFVPLLGVALTLLRLQEGVILEVVGHTDSVGGSPDNQRLSQQRVEAVKEFFVSQGIDPARIVAVGQGEDEPRANNHTEAGRQANRRVEFLITGFRFSD